MCCSVTLLRRKKSWGGLPKHRLRILLRRWWTPILNDFSGISTSDSKEGKGMRVAITGARGFVGPHFVDALRRLCGSSAEIVATARIGGRHPVLREVLPLDITDREAVDAFMADVQPTHVMHLAGIASPGAA